MSGNQLSAFSAQRSAKTIATYAEGMEPFDVVLAQYEDLQ